MAEEKAGYRPPPLVWALVLVPVLVAILAFAGVLFFVLSPRVPESGVELGYRIAAPAPGLEAAARRRLDSLMLPGAAVRLDGDLLVLTLPGATPDTTARVKRLFRSRGLLELRPAATLPVQEKYNADKIVPPDFEAIRNAERSRGGEYEAYGDWILVRKGSAIGNGRFVQAEAREERAIGGPAWVTSFELDAEGAKMFDEVAERLYNQRPQGLIAITLDGVLKNAPAVRSSHFNGRGQISGAKTEDEAKDLALILKSGALPVPLGEPELEKPFGPPKK